MVISQYSFQLCVCAGDTRVDPTHRVVSNLQASIFIDSIIKNKSTKCIVTSYMKVHMKGSWDLVTAAPVPGSGQVGQMEGSGQASGVKPVQNQTYDRLTGNSRKNMMT